MVRAMFVCVATSGAALAEPEPDDSSRLEGGERTWEADQAQRRAALLVDEVRRLEPEVARMRESDDRQAVEQLIRWIRGTYGLDSRSRERLLADLLDRQVLLLVEEAVEALTREETDESKRLIVTATRVREERGPGAPVRVVRAIERAVDRHVHVVAFMAEEIAREGNIVRAKGVLRGARGVLTLVEDLDAGVARKLSERIAAGSEVITSHHVAAIVERGRKAERERALRVALDLYGEASRQGADVSGDIARINAERRNPVAEGALSLAAPGLGQASHGRPVVGGLFFVGTAAAVTGGLLLNASAESRYSDYRAATDAAEARELYDGVGARWTGALVLFGTATLLHLWNIYDAYADAHRFNRKNF